MLLQLSTDYVLRSEKESENDWKGNPLLNDKQNRMS